MPPRYLFYRKNLPSHKLKPSRFHDMHDFYVHEKLQNILCYRLVFHIMCSFLSNLFSLTLFLKFPHIPFTSNASLYFPITPFSWVRHLHFTFSLSLPCCQKSPFKVIHFNFVFLPRFYYLFILSHQDCGFSVSAHPLCAVLGINWQPHIIVFRLAHLAGFKINICTSTWTPPTHSSIVLLYSSGSVLTSLCVQVTNHIHQHIFFTPIPRTTATSPTQSTSPLLPPQPRTCPQSCGHQSQYVRQPVLMEQGVRATLKSCRGWSLERLPASLLLHFVYPPPFHCLVDDTVSGDRKGKQHEKELSLFENHVLS